VLGREVAFPILVAPSAFQRLADPDGELAVARAAKSAGSLMVLSTISTVPLEDVAATGVARWFQLYVMRDRSITEGLVRRAHAAGYEVLVLTVDTPYLGSRLRDVRNRLRLPPGVDMVNLPEVSLPESPGGPGDGDDPGSELQEFFAAQH